MLQKSHILGAEGATRLNRKKHDWPQNLYTKLLVGQGAKQEWVDARIRRCTDTESRPGELSKRDLMLVAHEPAITASKWPAFELKPRAPCQMKKASNFR